MRRSLPPETERAADGESVGYHAFFDRFPNNVCSIWTTMFLDRKCIIFDLDGTLIDSLGIWSQVDQALIEERSSEHVKVTEEAAYEMRAEAMRRYGEGSDAYLKFCADLKAKFGMPGTPEEIHARRYDIAQTFLRTRVDYRPDADKVLEALKRAGLKLALATTTRRRNVDTYSRENENLRAKAPLDAFFDMIVTRDDVKATKPDPEAHLMILEKLGLAPEECLVVEDAAPGMIAARAAGIDSIVISERHAEGEREKLDALAVARFEDHAAILAAIEAEAAAR